MAQRPDRPADRSTFSRQPMHPAARAQKLDMLIGILAFFTTAAFVVAAVAEVQGKSAGRQALVLLLFAVLLGVALRLRRRS